MTTMKARDTPLEHYLASTRNQGAPRGFSRVTDFLFLGGCREARDPELLSKHGVTHVINTAEQDCPTGEGLYTNVQYLGFSARDQIGYDIMRHVDDVYEAIESARRSGGRAFVHCRVGMNRSAALVVAYLMLDRRIGPVEAALIVAQARGLILTNPTFQQRLVQLAKERGLLHTDEL